MYITPGTRPGYTQCSTDWPEATTSSLSFGLDSFSPLSLSSRVLAVVCVIVHIQSFKHCVRTSIEILCFPFVQSTVLPLPMSLPVQQFLDEGIKFCFVFLAETAAPMLALLKEEKK